MGQCELFVYICFLKPIDYKEIQKYPFVINGKNIKALLVYGGVMYERCRQNDLLRGFTKLKLLL